MGRSKIEKLEKITTVVLVSFNSEIVQKPDF